MVGKFDRLEQKFESRIELLSQDTESAIDQLENKFDSTIQNLENKMQQIEYRMTIKLGTIVTIGLAAMTAVVKLL